MREKIIDGFRIEIRALKSGPQYVCTELSSGNESAIILSPGMGGYYEVASDNQYIVIITDSEQGKHGGFDELCAATYHKGQKAFINYQALGIPDSLLFHSVGGPANPFWVWIKNGGQVSSYPGDPGASIGRYKLTTTRITWETSQKGTSGNLAGLTIEHTLWARNFTPSTGIVGNIEQIDSIPVNPNNPINPPQGWF